MKNKIFATSLLALSLIAQPAFAQTANEAQANVEMMSQVTKAADFINNAAFSDKFEIESSNLAQGNSTSDKVRSFAAMMVNDHSKASQELLAVAKAAGISATPPPELQPRHRAIVDSLLPLRGAEFDARYIEAQVQAHTEGVALFTAYAQNGDNPELKAFAAKTLPTLQQHLEMVTAMKGQ
jgi:putative membrane protein